MTQRTYYKDDGPVWSWWGRPPVDAEPEAPTTDTHTIRWGYNLADLDRLARLACVGSVGGAVGYDAYQIAWDGLLDHLIDATGRPEPAGMVNAARAALGRRARDDRHHHGRSPRHEGFAPRFSLYWAQTAVPAASHEDTVVDQMALWQIWPTLTRSQREVLLSLAAHDDYGRAAAALGKNPGTAGALLHQGRTRFRALWHEGELPSRAWGMDRRRTNGGARVEATYRKARRNLLRRGAAA